MRVPVALVISLILAGCASPPESGSASTASFVLSLVAPEGTEPTIGVTSDGAIFVGGARAARDATPRPTSNVGAEAVYRSTDGGAQWVNVLVDEPQRGPADVDPWVWVDPLTDRVFNAPLYAACSYLSWSDDRGETWMHNAAGGCGTPGHDHQHLSTGPPARGVTTNGYPNVVYYAYASLRPGMEPVLNESNPVFGSNVYEGTAISVSLDGGATFILPVIARQQDPCVGGNSGAVAVAQDGTAYVGMPSCQGVDVAVSRDSGATWEPPVAIGGVGSQLGLAMDPSIGLDDAGNAHLAFIGADNVVYFASSKDGGRSWSPPERVQPPGVLASVFPVLVAGAADRVAVAYLGTASDPSTWSSFDPSDAPDDAAWHLYVSWWDGASFTTARATPEDDPVQRGCIWLRGGTNDCRNLGDFLGLSEMPEGRVVAAYVDGCDRCASATESRSRQVFAAIQSGGPLLR